MEILVLFVLHSLYTSVCDWRLPCDSDTLACEAVPRVAVSWVMSLLGDVTPELYGIFVPHPLLLGVLVSVPLF